MNNKLFVYGTLLNGNINPMSAYLWQQCRCIGQGRFAGELYEIDGYPGALYKPYLMEHVYGDILELTNPETTFERLDLYEMISTQFPEPYEYKREIIPISLISTETFTETLHETINCWVYLYNWDTSQLRRIPGGNYRVSHS